MWHLTSFLHVGEVSDEVNHDRGGRVVTNLSQPLILDVFKARALCDVKDKENAIAALVEISRDRPE